MNKCIENKTLIDKILDDKERTDINIITVYQEDGTKFTGIILPENRGESENV